MAASTEYSALQASFLKLTEAMSETNLSSLARRHFEMNLIPSPTYFKVTQEHTSTNRDKAVTILLCVLNQVSLHPSSFDVFLTILLEFPRLENVVQSLRVSKEKAQKETTGEYSMEGMGYCKWNILILFRRLLSRYSFWSTMHVPHGDWRIACTP